MATCAEKEKVSQERKNTACAGNNMSILHLSRVSCDDCHNIGSAYPGGAEGVRSAAKSEGVTHVNRDGKMADLCTKCLHRLDAVTTDERETT